MRVVILEVCRRPEIQKENTEGTILRNCFSEIGIPHVVYSNDRFWGDSPLSGKVVSGACGSGALSASFLAAGATGFVAPETEISWLNLGAFFKVFYSALDAGQDTQSSLSKARRLHPELASYRYYG